jgi:hypothetical protein
MKYDFAIRKLEIAIEKGQNNAMSVCLSVCLSVCYEFNAKFTIHN